jgi:N-methylhydantoinase A
MRYERQTTEIRVEHAEVPPEQLLEALAQRFHQRHEQLFNYHSAEPIALVNLRLKAVSPGDSLDFAKIGAAFSRQARGQAASRTRDAYFGPRHGLLPTRIVTRGQLCGGSFDGPLVIEEFDSTIVVPPGWRARLDALGNVMLELQ